MASSNDHNDAVGTSAKVPPAFPLPGVAQLPHQSDLNLIFLNQQSLP